jgi:6-phosphogluconolactonase
MNFWDSKYLKNSRRDFLKILGLGAVGFALPRFGRNSFASALVGDSKLVYVGTYTSGRSEGIYCLRLDLASGELRRIGVTKGVVNPSFLTIDRDARHLYAVNEVAEFAGKPTGAVSSFSLDQNTGALQLLSQQSSGGKGPCHLTLDRNERFLLAANYDDGSVGVLRVTEGALTPPIQIIHHQGSSVNQERQQGPHAHGVVMDQANRHLFVPDLGLDRIMIYAFAADSGHLSADKASAKLKPGAGPRHFGFHPTGRWAYAINELDSTVTAFSYNAAVGSLREVQNVSTLPADFSGKSFCAEIEVSSSGRFLYCSNRGHDSIAVFSVDQRTGKLSLKQHIATQGKFPRNFAIDPSGQFLLAANQRSDSVVTFRIDRKSGLLSPTGHQIDVPNPVCVTMSAKL